MSAEHTRFRCGPLNTLERRLLHHLMRQAGHCMQCSPPHCSPPYLLPLRAPRESQIPTALYYPIICLLSMSMRFDRLLPMSDKLLHGAPHEFLMVQRKRQLDNTPQLDLGPRARAPEKEAQAAELLLELLVPRH